MNKHVLLSNDTVVNWQLPSDTDLDDLSNTLKKAMESGTVITIDISLSDAPNSVVELHVNGANLVSCAVAQY